MREIDYGCSVTNKKTVGNYIYFLLSRVDNYNLILRVKSTQDEFLFRVLGPDEDISTVYNNAENETYKRPDELSISLKKYILSKLSAFLNSIRGDVENW